MIFFSILGAILGLLVVITASLGASWWVVNKLIMPFMGGVFGKTEVYIARRYLFSPKKKNAINLITFISVIGITIVTASLIIILSIFNGFQLLIVDMFSSFDPDIKIVPLVGRSIDWDEKLQSTLEDNPKIVSFSPVIENKALIKYIDKQHFVQVKGIKKDFSKISPLDTLVYQGSLNFRNREDDPMVVLGAGVAQIINANLLDNLNPLEVFVAGDDLNPMSMGGEGLITKSFFPAGYFSIQIEYDNKFVLMDYEDAESIFGLQGKCTGVELRLDNPQNADEIKKTLMAKLGPEYEVLTWYEQHKTLYEVMQNEKLIAYLVLTLVLLLAGVNIVGSLSMIVIEKNADIGILKSFGMTKGAVRRLFLAEGFMVGAIGGLAGLFIALVVGFVQERYGVVKLGGGESFLIDSWPLEMRIWDFVLIFITVFSLSILASWYPSGKAAAVKIVKALRH